MQPPIVTRAVFSVSKLQLMKKKIPWLKTWTELMVMTTCVYFQVLVSITQRSPPTGKGSTIHVWCICKGQCDFRRNSSTNCASIRDIKAKRWKKKDQKKKKEKKIGKEKEKEEKRRAVERNILRTSFYTIKVDVFVDCYALHWNKTESFTALL